jgi:hypothetical protein
MLSNCSSVRAAGPAYTSRLLKALISSSILVPLVSLQAAVSSFNFESTPLGSSTSVSATDNGLTLNVTSTGGWVIVGSSSVALLGSRSVIGSDQSTQAVDHFAPLKFSFSAPVSSVTFLFGDGGGDEDSPVTISAYNSLNVLLSSINDTYPAGFATGKSAVWNGADASYFIVQSTPGFNNHSLWWEASSVTFGQSVPDSTGTLGAFLLSLSLIVYFSRKYRRPGA